MGAAAAVAPSTEEAASVPSVAQPDFTDTISEGGADVAIVGVRNSNTDGDDHRQYGGEPAAPYDHYHM